VRKFSSGTTVLPIYTAGIATLLGASTTGCSCTGLFAGCLGFLSCFDCFGCFGFLAFLL